MIDLNNLTEEIEASKYLFNYYLSIDDKRISIFWYPCKGEIRFLEVLENETSTGNIWPVRFSPTSKVPFPTVNILLGIEDYELLNEGELSLPAQWVDGIQLYPSCPKGWLDTDLIFKGRYNLELVSDLLFAYFKI